MCNYIFAVLAITFFHCRAQSSEVFFDIKKISNHVYVASQKKSVRVDATSTILVGTDFIAVIDAHSNEASSHALINQIKKEVSDKPIKYLVLTHPHIDNSIGASYFKSCNPHISIISHPWTRERMKSLHKTLEGHIRHVNQLAKGLESSKNSEDKDRYKELQIFKNDLLASKIALPNITVTDSLTLYDEDFTIKVFHLGHGHTPGDLLVYVPEEKLIITGDLIHDFDPLYFGDANPEEWIAILKKIETFPFEYLVGGRGSIQLGKQVLISFTNYISELVDVVKKGIQAGQTKDEFIRSISITSLNSLSLNSYGSRIQSMREKFLDPVWVLPLEQTIRNNISQIWDYYTRNK
jgi:cyclase